MGLELGSSVKTPGVKPADISAEAPKGEEGALDGLVIDIDGHVYDAGDAAQASATSQDHSEGSTNIVNALALKRSMQDVMNDTNLDDIDMAMDESMAQSIAQSGNTTIGKVKSAQFCESVDSVCVPAYSEHYERHPRRIMTTDNGVCVV